MSQLLSGQIRRLFFTVDRLYTWCPTWEGLPHVDARQLLIQGFYGMLSDFWDLL